jgi:DNA-directed RNA polymerase specialized sigma24 family protein
MDIVGRTAARSAARRPVPQIIAPAGPAHASAEDGVTALYHAHALGLIRLAHIMLGDRTAAEDVVRDAFCGLYRHWSRLADQAKALPYVRSSVLNGCRSALRRTAAPGRSLRSAKLVLNFGLTPSLQVSPSLDGPDSMITPDGSRIVASTAEVSHRPTRTRLTVSEYSAATGARAAVLAAVTLHGNSVLYRTVLWSSPDGSKLIVSALPASRPGALIGVLTRDGDRSRRAGQPALRQPDPGRVLHPDGQPRRHVGAAGGPARRALRAGGARRARAGCLRGRRVAGRPQAGAGHARRQRVLDPCRHVGLRGVQDLAVGRAGLGG